MKIIRLLLPHLTHPPWWISCCPFVTPSSSPWSSNTHTVATPGEVLPWRCFGASTGQGLPIVGESWPGLQSAADSRASWGCPLAALRKCVNIGVFTRFSSASMWHPCGDPCQQSRANSNLPLRLARGIC